ncbi:MAG: MoaD/ThiS family protein [Hyphomonadaceae bacterium]
MTTLIYLGRLADVAGTSEEQLDLPDTIKTTDDLRAWLNTRFSSPTPAFDQSVRIALDSEICVEPASLGTAIEIAFLPPVGGG